MKDETVKHPEYVAFLNAIGAEPDNDTPRLACADWLDEHDEAARAAFIRLQIANSKLPKYEGDYPNCAYCGGDGMDGAPPYHRACRPCNATGKRDHKAYLAHKDALAVAETTLKTHGATWRRGNLAYRSTADVIAEQGSIGGCCDRHADNMACECRALAVDVTYARGFIDSVDVSIDYLLDPHPVRKCARCNGTGSVTDLETQARYTRSGIHPMLPPVKVCPICHSKRVIISPHAFVPDEWVVGLVIAEPTIQRIHPRGIEMAETTRAAHAGFFRCRDTPMGPHNNPWMVPIPWFTRLKDHVEEIARDGPLNGAKYYDDKDKGHLDLGLAVVSWVRDKIKRGTRRDRA